MALRRPYQALAPNLVLVLAGFTGAGKSSLGLSLAKRLGGEIISADSVQVYRGLDIGSAKLAPPDQDGIPHHLIDILPSNNVDQRFSVGEWCRLARSCIDDIQSRNKVPIVVGGTGMYVDWLIHGNGSKESPSPKKLEHEDILKRIQSTCYQGDWRKAVYDSFAVMQIELDDKSRSYIETHLLHQKGNVRRLLRAIQRVMHGDVPLPLPSTLDSRYDFRTFFLDTDRQWIYRRLDLRCEEMLQAGILYETQRLLDQGLLQGDSIAGSAIGYRQAIQMLETCGGLDHCTDNNVYTFLSDFQNATRKLAKKQAKWFHRTSAPNIQFIDLFSGREELRPLSWPVHRDDLVLSKNKMKRVARRVEEHAILSQDDFQKRVTDPRYFHKQETQRKRNFRDEAHFNRYLPKLWIYPHLAPPASTKAYA